MDKRTSPAPKNGISGNPGNLDPVSIIRKDAITEGVNPNTLLIAVK
jgi:hypothetical protein